MLSLTASEVEAIPVDELAMRVLADFAAHEGWNRRNWVLEHSRGEGLSSTDRKTLNRCLSEAWGWLDARCLVACEGDSSSPDSRFITRLGAVTLERGLEHLRAVERLDLDLLPILERKARPLFLRGDFETAVFVAFKEVEVELRSRSGASDSLIGVKLAREALGQGKPLARDDVDSGEVVAEMELFAGALGLFKNPSSHRPVDYQSATMAAEAILLADLLLRLLDR